MYGYIYKTTNLVTGRIYIGQKHSKVFLGQKYLGSGTIFVEAVKKYGKQNFKVELLQECSSRDELNCAEKYWIAKYDARNRKVGYNIAEGGAFGVNMWENLSAEEHQALADRIKETKKRNGTDHPSDETRRKTSETLMGHQVVQETRDKISSTKKEFYQTDEGIKLRNYLSEIQKGKEPGNKGKKMTEEQLQKTRAAHQPGWYRHKEETKKQISNTMKTKIATGEIVMTGRNTKSCMNLDTGEQFTSLTEAAKKYGIKNATYIVYCSEGKQKTCGGYHWKLL